MTVTPSPASWRARHSCQTRRFIGTDRSSTMKRALPRNADVLRLLTKFRGVGETHEIDHDASVVISDLVNTLGVVRADDADLCVSDQFLLRVHEKRREIGDMAVDVFPIRSHDPAQRHGWIVDLQIETLAEQLFAELDEWTVAQIVGSGLEGQTDDADAAVAEADDQV